MYLCIVVKNKYEPQASYLTVLHFLCYILIMNPFMTGHRALEKKQITQGDNRKVQNPSGSQKERNFIVKFLFCLNIS